ncbi:MAG TPA: hypothetical protein VNA25_00995 [Phycisphaerae bacterium]|nr:hypothetical protein [Phycisphaerae bacterium]
MIRNHRDHELNRRSWLLVTAGAVLVAMAAAGCRTAAAPPVRRSSTVADPCADRLHDICGQFLLYFSVEGEMPATLDDLNRMDSQTLPPLVCPISGKPYLYNKNGLRVPGRTGLLVLYDAEPVHSGMRWGIMVEAGGAGQPLSGRVVLLPESSVFSTNK